MKNVVFVLFFALVVTACGVTTPYQKSGFFSGTGGYEDRQVEDGVYFIKSKVNANTPAKTALEYWHRRAAELCGHTSYKHEIEQIFDTNTNYGASMTTSHQWPVASGHAYCK